MLSGEMLGKKQKVKIIAFDISPMIDKLKGANCQLQTANLA